MSAYVLTDRLRATLVSLVKTSREAGTDAFTSRTRHFGNKDGLIFTGTGGNHEIDCPLADVLTMRNHGAVDLGSVSLGGLIGSIPRASFDAVDQGFPPPAGPVAQQNTVHNYAPSQQAFGAHAQQTMSVAGPVDAERLAAVTAQLVAAIREAVGPAAAVPVVEAVEAARDAATGPAANRRTAAVEAGQAVTTLLKTVILAGTAVASVDQTVQLVGHWVGLLWATATSG